MTRAFNSDISLLIADDEVSIGHAFERLLGQWYRIVGTASNLDEVGQALRQLRTGVAVMDVSFDGQSSIRRLASWKKEHPAVGFAMFSGHTNPMIVEAAFLAGASAYVVKLADEEELCHAIDEVAAGRTFVSPRLYMQAHEPASAFDVLVPSREVQPTPRQLEVLALLRFGHLIPETARKLGIATKTVDEHLRDMRERTGISRREMLIRWGEQFMLPPSAPPPPDPRPRRARKTRNRRRR